MGLGRPKKYKEELSQVGLYLPISYKEYVNEQAKSLDVSVNEYLNNVIVSADKKLAENLTIVFKEMKKELSAASIELESTNKELLSFKKKSSSALSFVVKEFEEDSEFSSLIDEITGEVKHKFLSSVKEIGRTGAIDSFVGLCFNRLENKLLKNNKLISKPIYLKTAIKKRLLNYED